MLETFPAEPLEDRTLGDAVLQDLLAQLRQNQKLGTRWRWCATNLIEIRGRYFCLAAGVIYIGYGVRHLVVALNSMPIHKDEIVQGLSDTCIKYFIDLAFTETDSGLCLPAQLVRGYSQERKVFNCFTASSYR